MGRHNRTLGDPNAPISFYHCTSRIVDGQMALGTEEAKGVFHSLMREYEKFCQVQVITYCIMDNHFHVLVGVPARPRELPDDAWLIGTLEELYKDRKRELADIRRRWELSERKPGARKKLRKKYFRRMWNLGEYMKSLKQCFSCWYNRVNRRKGTLWESRYHSVLVEADSEAMAVVAAYIDLNPVRAGIVARPEEFGWSGYGEAMRGEREQNQALAALMSPGNETFENYRKFLYAEGVVEGRGEGVRGGIRPEEVERLWASGGRLSLQELVRCQVRYLNAGGVLGTEAFVEGYFRRCRDEFGRRRKTGARELRGVDAPRLRVCRDLRRQPIG